MTIDPNDPRLTAFVLGELDPTERGLVEADLIESAECRQAVEEIRLTTQWLFERLQEESRAHNQAANGGVINHYAAAGTLGVPATEGDDRAADEAAADGTRSLPATEENCIPAGGAG